MSNERDRILKLLEDGKITADQATRLIEALGTGRTESDFGTPSFAGPRHFRMRGPRDFDRIPDVVATAVASAMKCGFEGPGEERSSDFPGKRNLLVKSVSGDLDVALGEDKGVTLSYQGPMVKARSSGDQVVVRTMAGDVSASVPADSRLELEVVSGDVSISEAGSRIEVKTVSGDVDIRQTKADVKVRTVSGDVNLDRVTGDFEVETRSGDIDLVASNHVSGSLLSVSGDVTLELPSSTDLTLELASEEDGDIDVDSNLTHEVLEERDGYLRIKLGAGTRTMRVNTQSADIEVREAETN